MIKVFIIDDHQVVTEGICALLQNESGIEWMGSCKKPSDLLLLLKKDQPDVLLMDINLPEINGLDLCEQVKKLYPAIHILALSTSDEASTINRMLHNGASGYLLKDANKKEILTAIQEVVKGRQFMNYSVAEIIKADKVKANSLPLLTKREREILALIAEGLTNPEIATQLFVTVTTVDSHRKNMLTKFGAKNTAALIKIAIVNKLI
ncbi:MAG: response regulator transcription factor [Chitinophagaceae bacterium]